MAWPAAACAEGLKAAVFDFELLDTSHEGELYGPREDQERRIALISARMRDMLAERGIMPVDLAPARERIAKAAPIRTCNGCERDLARDLGASVAVTGLVQKVSNLILNLNVAMRDVASGAVLRAGSVDIRGNTDESWLRGVSWLVRNRLLDPPLER